MGAADAAYSVAGLAPSVDAGRADEGAELGQGMQALGEGLVVMLEGGAVGGPPAPR